MLKSNKYSKIVFEVKIEVKNEIGRKSQKTDMGRIKPPSISEIHLREMDHTLEESLKLLSKYKEKNKEKKNLNYLN